MHLTNVSRSSGDQHCDVATSNRDTPLSQGLEAESVSIQAACCHGPVLDVEHLREISRPDFVGGGTILPRVPLNGSDARDACCKAGGMKEGESRASQVLHAQEHAELLRGGSSEQGFGMSLAGLEGDTAITEIARQQ